MNFFEKIIKTVTGSVKLVTTDKHTHMNVVVRDGGAGDGVEHAAVSLPIGKTLQLRDALNEVYPPVSVPTLSEYKFRKIDEYTRVDRWEVYQDYPNGWERKTDRVCITNRRDNARKIAQALNEAEGL